PSQPTEKVTWATSASRLRLGLMVSRPARGLASALMTGKFTRHYVSVNTDCLRGAVMYTARVPRLWTETVETHRREPRDAILHPAAALVAKDGLAAVTMPPTAEDPGIGRATLYKYFPDVETILLAWHERHVKGHLEHLAGLGKQDGSAHQRLRA